MADRDIGKVVAHAVLDVSQYQQGLQQMQQGTSHAVAGMGSVFSELKSTLGSLGLAVGAVEIGREILKVASAYEQLSITMRSFVGTFSGAESAIEKIRDIANATTNPYETMAASGQKLIAVGYQVAEVMRLQKSIGNASLGDPGRVEALTNILVKVRSTDSMTARDIMAMRKMGLPVEALKSNVEQQLGAPAGSFTNLASSGKVTADIFAKALEASLDARFGGLGAARQDSMAGQFTLLLNNLNKLGEVIGKAFAPVATTFLKAANLLLSGVAKMDPAKLAAGIETTLIAALWFANAGKIGGAVKASASRVHEDHAAYEGRLADFVDVRRRNYLAGEFGNLTNQEGNPLTANHIPPFSRHLSIRRSTGLSIKKGCAYTDSSLLCSWLVDAEPLRVL